MTSRGSVRIGGTGTAIRNSKLKKFIALADNQKYIGTPSVLAKQFDYSSSTISSVISILRSLGYVIKHEGRQVGYVVEERPGNLPPQFECLRSYQDHSINGNGNGKIEQLEIPVAATHDLCIEKMKKPAPPHAKPFGQGMFVSLSDWNKFLSDIEAVYSEYSNIVDAFNAA